MQGIEREASCAPPKNLNNFFRLKKYSVLTVIAPVNGISPRVSRSCNHAFISTITFKMSAEYTCRYYCYATDGV